MDFRIVTAGVLVREGACLVAKRKEGGALSGKWEFPGGKVEPGETRTAGLVREFLEELGAVILVGEFLCATRFLHAGNRYELRAYFVTLVSGEARALEHAELAWVLPEDMQRYDFADSDKAIIEALLKRNNLKQRDPA